eukprot:CAMPEP_0170624876 /NCGR_PEP_ID=MMETSP0224-20130122/30464_1 /TAXON_ID=285029 /ORGANISM="Togula jolla, Strain CCCM 725" /LENGTH=58 /DNA_ID=CAMNT_0010951423 /DNA_START=212 /DNA_END=388 /DNA_ORIENTATION=-
MSTLIAGTCLQEPICYASSDYLAVLLSSRTELAGHFGNGKLASSSAAAQATHVAAKAG